MMDKYNLSDIGPLSKDKLKFLGEDGNTFRALLMGLEHKHRPDVFKYLGGLSPDTPDVSAHVFVMTIGAKTHQVFLARDKVSFEEVGQEKPEFQCPRTGREWISDLVLAIQNKIDQRPPAPVRNTQTNANVVNFRGSLSGYETSTS